jgi:hypothetical protein
MAAAIWIVHSAACVGAYWFVSAQAQALFTLALVFGCRIVQLSQGVP